MKPRLLPLLLSLTAVSATSVGLTQDTPALTARDPLLASFQEPTSQGRLRVWWHWISGNVSREGITADLEAMKRAGLGGFNLFIVQQALPSGPVAYGTPEFYDLLRHTAEESARLGLTMEMTHSPGYSGTGGPWVSPAQASQQFVWSTARVENGTASLPEQPKTVLDHYRDIALFAFPTPPTQPGPVERNVLNPEPKPYPAPTATAVVASDQIIDLTAKMRADGTLDWTPPPGDWTLLRFGHTPTGKTTHPVPPEARGLEVNKLDRTAVEHAFSAGFDPVLRHLGPLAGSVLTGTLIDSYESGANDWFEALPAEFERRTGYALRPWLPVFAGYAVGGDDEARRFLWDYRKVIAELYSENYYTWVNELARRRGLTLNAEGNHSAGSTLTSNGVVDVPMMEFWRNGPGHSNVANEAISGAILYGRPRVAAESFSQFPEQAWRIVPEMMKPGSDHAFANGINQLYIHRFAHQPWPNVRPGITMGFWGMWFERTLTWWDQGIGYNTYVARAQSILQQGHTAIDALMWIGEGLSDDFNRVRGTPSFQQLRNLESSRLALMNGDTLRGPLKIKTGGLELPSGHRISTVALAPRAEVTLDSLRRLHDAVQSGLTLIGQPPTAAPGRQVQPDADAEFKRLVTALWGEDITSSAPRSVGHGRVIATDALVDALREHLTPTLLRESGAGRLAWLRRQIGDHDVFFVASDADTPSVQTLKLHTAGTRPEIWNPETGSAHPAPVWQPSGEFTQISLALPPKGSAFVVFHPKSANDQTDPIVEVRAGDRDAIEDLKTDSHNRLALRSRIGGNYEIKRLSGDIQRHTLSAPPAPQPIDGAWDVTFASDRSNHAATFDALRDWSTHDDDAIRFFSGTAEYRTQFNLSSEVIAEGLRTILDLGRVANFAEVSVNGRAFPVLWRAPWALDITDAIRAGQNTLTIRVTNTWVNRLIGDDHLPDDTTWRPGKAYGTDHPVAIATEWPEHVLNGTPSPTGRQAFAAVKIVHKGDSLPESGLIGPVRVVFERELPIK